MANAQKLGKTFDELKSLIARLQSGDLELAELESLVTHAQELYELSVVLRFKAYEEKLSPVAEMPVVIETAVEVTNNVIDIPVNEALETPVTTELEEVTQPAIEFSLFDEPSVLVSEEEVPQVQTNTEESISADTDDFFRRFTSMDPSLQSQIAMSRLETLVGSFGLNERLQFINELFDGSSEAFSEAIKSIDTQSDEHAALKKVSTIAAQFNWDNTSETVEEFVLKIKRRYA